MLSAPRKPQPHDTHAAITDRIYDGESEDGESGDHEKLGQSLYAVLCSTPPNNEGGAAQQNLARFQVRCSPQLKARLREAAFEARRSQNQLVLDILGAALSGVKVCNTVVVRRQHHGK